MPQVKRKTISIYTRCNEYKNIFRVDEQILYCNYCNVSVEWKHKSTVDNHCNSNKHKSNLKNQENNKISQSSILSIIDSRNNFVEDLVEAFTIANIPLEKINSLIPFFKKYVKNGGGSVPQAPTLRQNYLPIVFEKHKKMLNSIFYSKPVSIIVDETVDDCGRSVVNTIFCYRNEMKLVSVDFLNKVNNTTIGQTIISIISNYNISFNLPCLFLTDSAAYMKKCYNEILKPLMPQLIHIPCIAHILNLIGDTWRTFPQFLILKQFLENIKDIFVHSPARKRRYISYLKMNGINSPRKIPLYNRTRWNSWFQMVFYVKDYIDYLPGFFKEEYNNDNSHNILKLINEIFEDNRKWGTIKIFINFISIYAKKFVQDLDFFQKTDAPIFPFVESRLQQLTSYFDFHKNGIDYGNIINDIIEDLNFRKEGFYNVFQEAFDIAYEKFKSHIPNHPGRNFFHTCQVFDPKYIRSSDVKRKNIQQYFLIKEFIDPSNELLQEWGIYCNENEYLGNGELDKFWINKSNQLPILSNIAFNYIWLPVSSCTVERSFSMYNILLDSNRQNLSEDSIKKLNMLYFNKN